MLNDNTPDTALLATIQTLYVQLAELERSLAAFDAVNAAEAERRERENANNRRALESDIDTVKSALAKLIMDNHDALFRDGKSFSTALATVTARQEPRRFKVLDQAGILDQARKLGIVRKLTRIKITRVVIASMVEEYLKAHPEHLDMFMRLGLVAYDPEHQSLRIRPNDRYRTTYDPGRLTPSSTTLIG